MYDSASHFSVTRRLAINHLKHIGYDVYCAQRSATQILCILTLSIRYYLNHDALMHYAEVRLVKVGGDSNDNVLMNILTTVLVCFKCLLYFPVKMVY
jgi:hypothetical protein